LLPEGSLSTIFSLISWTTQWHKWNSAFFALSLIIEGTTEKVLQFIMPLKSFYNRHFGFIEQNMNFEHYREFQASKTQLIDIIFAMKKNIC
jgi:hypothetical protein